MSDEYLHGCWASGADRICEDGTKGCSREHPRRDEYAAAAHAFLAVRCEHDQPGGSQFCIFCLRARGDRMHLALSTIAAIEPCSCPCCGDHEAVTEAKRALAAEESR